MISAHCQKILWISTRKCSDTAYDDKVYIFLINFLGFRRRHADLKGDDAVWFTAGKSSADISPPLQTRLFPSKSEYIGLHPTAKKHEKSLGSL
jgi:hypothetical protein